MNRYLKRATAIALSGAMCMGMLGGCGDKKESQEQSQFKTLAQELGYGYVGSYSNLDDLGLSYVNQTSSAQGKLYLYGEQYDETAMTSTQKLLAKDLSTGDVTEIPLPELMEAKDNSGEYVIQLVVNSDGSGYWMVSNQYSYTILDDMAVPKETTETTTEEASPEEPATEEPATEEPATEEAAPEEDAGMAGEYQAVLLAEETPLEEGEAPAEETVAPEENQEAPTEEVPAEEVPTEEMLETQNVDRNILRKCDMSGNVLLEIDLTEDTKDMEYFYPMGMAQDAQGNIYVAADEVILCYGSDGSRKADVPVNNMYLRSLVATETGVVLVNGWDNETGNNVMGRLENGGITQLEPPDAGLYMNWNVYGGSGNNVLLSSSDKLYSMDVVSGESTALLSWTECDINGGFITGVVADGTDKVLVLTSDYIAGPVGYELGILTKTPLDQMPQRTVLTLGMDYMDSNFQRAVIKFNRNSDTYRVNIVNYESYNTQEDYTAGADQLDRDIISGSCPDILAVSSSKVGRYTAKGALADLTPLMEKDGEFTQDSLLSGPVKFFQEGDKLYGLPSGFNLQTMVASAKLVGDKTSWTMAELSQMAEGLPDGVRLTAYYTQADFLSVMTYQNLNQFVDYGTASCSFDSDAFRQLLNLAAKLPDTYDTGSADGVEMSAYDDDFSQVQRGDVLLTTEHVYDSDSIKTMYQLYNQDNGFVRIGFPTDGSSSGGMISIQNGLAISSRCKNQEGAWAFLKTMLSDEVQGTMWSLPVTVSAFDKVLEDAMKPNYYTDQNGNQVESTYSTYIGDTEYKIVPVTQDQAEDFKAYVNSASLCGDYDTDIMDIVTEEAGAFFAGDKTAEEAAKLIQNRVTTYLGENS